MEKVGKERLEVLLLSVDDRKDKKFALDGDAAKLKANSVTWPNVLVPGGWKMLRERFNISLYGLTLIGPDGKTLATRVKPDEILKLIEQLDKEQTR